MMDFAWLSFGVALVDRTSGRVLESNPSFDELLQLSDDNNNSKSSVNVLEKLKLTAASDLPATTASGTVAEHGDSKCKDVSMEKLKLTASDLPATTASGTVAEHDDSKCKDVSISKGKWLQVRSKCVPRDDNAIFLEVEDVTKRVEADRRSMSFLELSFDGFWDWHMKEDYEYMSPRFWEMFGYEPHEKKHHPAEWQNIIFQEDVPAVMETLNQHVATRGAHPFRSECRYRHKNGGTVIVYCNGRVIEWDEKDGSPVRMIGTHTDITELRQRQKIATEHRIHEYLAHKVRNPLTSAVGAVRFWHESIHRKQRWESEEARQEAERDVVTVHDNLMDISSILGRLAELHRIHRGDVAFTKAPALIHSCVLAPVTNLCKEELLSQQDGVVLEVECDANLKANMDVLRVKQVLFGLLESAAARMRSTKSGGFIRVEARSDSDDATSNGNSMFVIQVEDSGPAVDIGDDLLLGGSSDGVQQSTSGLHPSIYVTRALINKMGGMFYVDKSFTEGLKIIVRLPGLLQKTNDPGEEKEEEKNDVDPRMEIDDYYKGASCLVIEDDRIVQKMLVRRLGNIIPGGKVDAAESGEKGIELAKQNNYSLIIVDHYLEGPMRPLTGAETICQLRLHGIRAPILGCSANDVSALHLEAGANSFIQKPTPKKNEQFIAILNSVVPRISPQLEHRISSPYQL